ncbi:metallophosphoesterase family protein [Brevundimonas sp.]|uniref:metallophosphoesterase family protein n=1 Tax=Brevundimonas sp. TaxID=1871086 RepID=UPI002D25B05C|nr:metallophosphoesterase family protein [Brevundimonas sp.]HYC67383.1 metallophosphoesterase family protein [Brevundimonas sp.]
MVWSVGDIHGRDDLLKPLVEAIRADLRTSDAPRKLVVFLGDYIDRGPGSREVLRYLAALPPEDGVEWRFLKGNHEETMLKFLNDPSVGAQWCEYGGDATLRSYGLRPPDLKHRLEAWRHLSSDLDHKLTGDERALLSNLEMSVTVGDYFFAHAGARPGEPLESQSAEDLLWIRSSFLRSEVEFEKVVVHGHTPTAEVHADRRRIGIDTRAYESGMLTALKLSGAGRCILQAVEPKPVETGAGGLVPREIALRWTALPAVADLQVARG